IRRAARPLTELSPLEFVLRGVSCACEHHEHAAVVPSCHPTPEHKREACPPLGFVGTVRHIRR
ncbi:MAG: hypothetical protein ACLQAT_24505, partial [Candidatus Binataceae bacterium]